MSHRAIVAYEVGDGVFDVHYSHNGAQELQLLPLLQEQFEDGRQKPGVDEEIQEVPQMEKWGSLDDIQGNTQVETTRGNEAVERDPVAQEIPLRAIGLTINMADYEALYLVRSGSVQVYIPVWAYPNVIQPWRDQLRAEVYKAGRLPDNPQAMAEEMQETEPLRVIDDEALSDNFLDDTITTRVVRDHHEDIYPIVQQAQDKREELEEQADGPIEPMSTLMTDSYRIRITPQSGGFGDLDLPPATGQGLFIKAGTGNASKRPTELDAAEARFQLGGRLNVRGHEPTEDDIIEAQAALLIELHKTFGDRIATFSPPPHGPVIKALQKTDTVAESAEQKLAKIIKRN